MITTANAVRRRGRSAYLCRIHPCTFTERQAWRSWISEEALSVKHRDASPLGWDHIDYRARDMDEERLNDAKAVRLLALRAGLKIPPERVGQVAAILSAWQADAVVLSQRMSERRFDERLPITIFSHGTRGEGDAS